jgi:hypothetical protein
MAELAIDAFIRRWQGRAGAIAAAAEQGFSLRRP